MPASFLPRKTTFLDSIAAAPGFDAGPTNSGLGSGFRTGYGEPTPAVSETPLEERILTQGDSSSETLRDLHAAADSGAGILPKTLTDFALSHGLRGQE